MWPATYAIEDVIPPPKGASALDHNHTHFLLVDNGTEKIYGTEIKFRSKIESYISSKGSTGVSESQGREVKFFFIENKFFLEPIVHCIQ